MPLPTPPPAPAPEPKKGFSFTAIAVVGGLLLVLLCGGLGVVSATGGLAWLANEESGEKGQPPKSGSSGAVAEELVGRLVRRSSGGSSERLVGQLVRRLVGRLLTPDREQPGGRGQGGLRRLHRWLQERSGAGRQGRQARPRRSALR